MVEGKEVEVSIGNELLDRSNGRLALCLCADSQVDLGMLAGEMDYGRIADSCIGSGDDVHFTRKIGQRVEGE